MDGFTKSVSELLEVSQSTLNIIPKYSDQWQVLSKTTCRTRKVLDTRHMIAAAFFGAEEELQLTPEYIRAKDIFDIEIAPIIGAPQHYGQTFPVFFQRVLTHSLEQRGKHFLLKKQQAEQYCGDLQELLAQEAVNYTSRARLFGLDTTIKAISLPKSLSIVRLSIAERNASMPTNDWLVDYRTTDFLQLAHAPCEVVAKFKIEIDRSLAAPYTFAASTVKNKAKTVFNETADALMLAVPGVIEVGNLEVSGGPPGTDITYSVNPPPEKVGRMKLTAANIAFIDPVLAFIREPEVKDQVLDRSCSRFLMANRRQESLDKLVDLVIAWESILLTSVNAPIKQESAYRFSLNGAVLTWSKKRSESRANLRSRFSVAYGIRSQIVHGVGQGAIDKELRKSNFSDIRDLNQFLEAKYRDCLLRLIGTTYEERPYVKRGGWDELVFA